MKPTVKAKEIEDVLTSLSGDDRREAIYENRCLKPPIGCGQAVIPEEWDALSRKEFSISGLCADCQDGIFDTKSSRVVPQMERQYYTPTENDYVIHRQPMICGSFEAESRRYYKHLGKDGRMYLVADQPDAAANIYVEGGPNSDGFGGRTLTFPLVDGGEIKLKGPWHTNSEDLFRNTGVDVRDRHYTFVVVSRRRESGKNYESICADVLYRDDRPQLGSFHRGDVIAREWARSLNQKVHLYSQSSGGSSSGFVEPNAVFYWEKDTKTGAVTSAQDAIIRS